MIHLKKIKLEKIDNSFTPRFEISQCKNQKSSIDENQIDNTLKIIKESKTAIENNNISNIIDKKCDFTNNAKQTQNTDKKH